MGQVNWLLRVVAKPHLGHRRNWTVDSKVDLVEILIDAVVILVDAVVIYVDCSYLSPFFIVDFHGGSS
jgi:hypothetical protein